MLQCYHRLKRIEREMKGGEANATDDEVRFGRTSSPDYADIVRTTSFLPHMLMSRTTTLKIE
jgi:hypothetical protein